MANILLVEDNGELARGIQYNLELEGHAVHVAEDGIQALDALNAMVPDIIILDVMLPGLDGFQVLRKVRERGIQVPVMMLTARGEESDHVRAFRLDADQYVTKPFRLLELLERINMMLRRAPSQASTAEVPAVRITFGDVVVDTDARQAFKSGRDVGLTPKAFDLLLALIESRGRALSRQELLRTVWKHQAVVLTRTVDTHVSELRQKLEDDSENPRHIITVWKTGYRFEP